MCALIRHFYAGPVSFTSPAVSKVLKTCALIARFIMIAEFNNKYLANLQAKHSSAVAASAQQAPNIAVHHFLVNFAV